jgi:antirestriction protein
MTTLYAQPYDISATGFYFETAAEYEEKAAKLRNSSGWPVEEFEIQFIDGERIDGQLFEALNVHQGNFGAYLEVLNDWDENQKRKAIIAVGECGYSFTLGQDDPDDLDVDIYEIDTMRDLALQFVDEGLFGDIPDHLQNYIDYDAMARDLAIDYSQTNVAGTRLIYRCG